MASSVAILVSLLGFTLFSGGDGQECLPKSQIHLTSWVESGTSLAITGSVPSRIICGYHSVIIKDVVRTDAVPPVVLQWLPDIKSVTFIRSNLSVLPVRIFEGLSSVEILRVVDCGLTSTDVLVLDRKPNLRFLDLSDNRLEAVPYAVLDKLSRAGLTSRQVTLAGNRWKCDCSIKPLRDWLVTEGSPCQNGDCFYCITPPDLANLRIVDVWNRDLPACLNTVWLAIQYRIALFLGVALVTIFLVWLVVVKKICSCKKKSQKYSVNAQGQQNLSFSGWGFERSPTSHNSNI